MQVGYHTLATDVGTKQRLAQAALAPVVMVGDGDGIGLSQGRERQKQTHRQEKGHCYQDYELG